MGDGDLDGVGMGVGGGSVGWTGDETRDIDSPWMFLISHEPRGVVTLRTSSSQDTVWK